MHYSALPKWIQWTLRLVPAIILVQSLFFKFSGAEESILLFTTIGLEPIGRIGIGIAELIIAIVLLVPRTTVLGALAAASTMAGAVFFHLFTPLGIAIQLPNGESDGGGLFTMAVLVLLLSLLIVYFHRSKLPIIRKL